MINTIPSELVNPDHFPNDVSILIGENGSGKSTLLNNLSQHFLGENKIVVALANSIHDKFESGHKNFKTLRGRSGRRQARHTIKNALQNIAESDPQRLKNASMALAYVDFEPTIGFEIINLKPHFREIINGSDLSDKDKEKLIYLLNRVVEFSRNEKIWLQVDSFNFLELQQSSLTEIFIWENKLKKIRAFDRIEVFLKKKGKIISMLDASSGELALITSFVYLSTVITEKTVILIDEPENSLHPRWQKEYAKILMDLFYFFQPKIIIATHSPLIVNGAELFIETSQIFKAENFLFEKQNKEALNVEEIYFRFFDVTTPQNRYLSQILIRWLNALAAKKISISAFDALINKISLSAYDPEQKNVLDSIKILASEIDSNNLN